MLIPNERCIDKRFQISRDDGSTWVDVTDYLTKTRINFGDTSGIGVNASGTDGVVRQLDFNLHNDIGYNFNPLDKISPWNLVSSQYSPLLFPYRRVKLETRIYDTRQDVKYEVVGIGDGIETEFYTSHALLINGVVSIEFFTSDPTWWVTTTTAWSAITTSWTELGKIAAAAAIAYTVDNTTGKITFASPLPSGVYARVSSYSYWANDSGFIPVFEGYLGDSIQEGEYGVDCQCRDLAKLLQDTYIETEVQYGTSVGSPAETEIQKILDDNLGVGIVTLYTPVSPGFAVLDTEAAKINYMSVWDAIQKITGMFGWFCGYVLDWNTLAFRLTLMEPPRSKTHSRRDFELSHIDDFHSQSLEISDRDVRNKWTVTYRNASTGARESVTVQDDNSISLFRLKAAKMEQSDTSLIDTAEEATALANAALDDTKFATGLTQIELPYLHNMDVFAGVLTHHPKLSSSVDFYGVQSISHELTWSGQQRFRTIITGTGQVVGGSEKWQRVMTRPGAADIKNNALYGLYVMEKNNE